MASITTARHRPLHGSIALILACCACSSDMSSSAVAPITPFTGSTAGATAEPGAPASATSETASPPASAGETGSPSASAAPSASETPVPPDIMLQGAAGASQSDSSAAASSGSAGSTNADQPASMNAAGAGGTDGASPAQPSAACSASGGATPAFNIPNTLFSIPRSYDGTTPLPVVIAFHAAGNPNTQLQGILGGTLQNDYIMFYPKSDGNGWSNGPDAPKIDAIFAALDASACYDKNRVFATGHSSGAQFVVQRLCAGESRWRAVATVASSVYCSSWKPIPALVIHGIGDTERQAYGLNDGDGLKDIVPYRTSNGCDANSSAFPVDGCTSEGVQVDPGCRDFNGCNQLTRWCQHNDPQYGTSHHGVPCFGARVIKQFFDLYQ